MSALATMLRERREEFDAHHSLAVSLEDEIFGGEDISIGGTRLSARHLMTMKSGLIIHLYNVVEATMTRATRLVGAAFGTVPPKTWSAAARKEWLREHGVARVQGGDESRLDSMEALSTKLLAEGPLGYQAIRKPPGSWTDASIGTFCYRLGVTVAIGPELHRKMAKMVELGDKTPMEFLADRRNDVAHGHRTFEEGAHDLTLARIRHIAETTFEFMELIANSFQDYVDQKRFVATP